MRRAAPANHDLYGVQGPAGVPLYRVREAAHYLGIPRATLRAWAFGQPGFKRLLDPPDPRRRELSFTNLVEAHVLDALRREHHLSVRKVRPALDYLRQEFGSAHPLVDHKLKTDGLDLFVEKYGQLINASQHGQLGMRRVLEAYLRRVEWNDAGAVVRLYPFTRRESLEQPKTVVIDPRLALGRPVLAGTNIPTAVIAQRYKAGESLADLAGDYDRPAPEIEEAIRCELAA